MTTPTNQALKISLCMEALYIHHVREQQWDEVARVKNLKISAAYHGQWKNLY